MFYPYYDPTYIFILPAIIFALYAQSKVQRAFNQYLRVQTQRGYRGYDVARAILDHHGLGHIPIEPIQGHLSDHYDPRSKVLRLSRDVYNGTSVAAVSVAAHEVGHALQDAQGYFPLTLRGILVPVANIGSTLAFPLVFAGFFLDSPSIIDVGILLYIAAVLFTVVTLPVEYNASNRAMAMLEMGGFITPAEYTPAKKVLGAAALTYVAAMATAVAQLFRLLTIRNRRRD